MNKHIWIPLYANCAVIIDTSAKDIVEYCLGDLVTVLLYNCKLNYTVYNHRTGTLMELPISYVRNMSEMVKEGK